MVKKRKQIKRKKVGNRSMYGNLPKWQWRHL
jgi:hypothetical protein